MPDLKLYISSTFLDMVPVRKKILDTIRNNLHNYFELTDVMEMMRGDGENRSNIDICLANVKAADVYIILVGKRFGSAPTQFNDLKGDPVMNTEGRSDRKSVV